MNEGDNNIDEIRRDIEDTRLRISTEIEAIEERLTPAHAKEIVMEKVNETRDRVTERIGDTASMVRSNATRVRSDLGTAVRANPIPVALIGVGTGWLVWETLRPRREFDIEPLYELDVEVEPGYAASGYDDSVYGVGIGDGRRTTAEERARLANVKQRASGLAQDAKQRASGIAHGAKQRAYGAKDRASHLAHDAKDRASHLAHDARDRASHLAHDARDRGRMVAHRSRDVSLRARDVTSEAYDSNPIAFGALALAAGVGLALLMPHTRREDRTFGPARERVVSKAKELAATGKEIAKDSVREGATAARETAKREAEERHLVR